MNTLKKFSNHINKWAIIYVLLSYVFSCALLISFCDMDTDWCGALMCGCGFFWLAVMLIVDKACKKQNHEKISC